MVPAGRTTTLLHCARCSTTPLCERCLYPCSGSACTNQSCQVVSLLLTCDRVTDSASKVYGCPLFRACPKCHNVMMHQSGCKYVMCGQCTNIYCFICLRIKQVCVKDKDLYFSLTCSAPRAARQRFQTWRAGHKRSHKTVYKNIYYKGKKLNMVTDQNIWDCIHVVFSTIIQNKLFFYAQLLAIILQEALYILTQNLPALKILIPSFSSHTECLNN